MISTICAHGAHLPGSGTGEQGAGEVDALLEMAENYGCEAARSTVVRTVDR